MMSLLSSVLSDTCSLETDIVVQDVCDAIEHDIIQRLTGTPEPATFGGPVCSKYSAAGLIYCIFQGASHTLKPLKTRK